MSSSLRRPPPQNLFPLSFLKSSSHCSLWTCGRSVFLSSFPQLYKESQSFAQVNQGWEDGPNGRGDEMLPKTKITAKRGPHPGNPLSVRTSLPRAAIPSSALHPGLARGSWTRGWATFPLLLTSRPPKGPRGENKKRFEVAQHLHTIFSLFLDPRTIAEEKKNKNHSTNLTPAISLVSRKGTEASCTGQLGRSSA